MRWIELLTNGLSFDLAGLAPGDPSPESPRGDSFGLPEWLTSTRPEAITLRPGPHLTGGATMPPVVRALAGLTARLAAAKGAAVVVWHPARCWSLPRRDPLGGLDFAELHAMAEALWAGTKPGSGES